ncbi:nucleotidyltransferase [Radiobacillus deserti]|uniref:tRNA(Met) cytidine acetate ligase n=1 Tax=Radiobacillus deserti TaxID=2594883 RepID=A0A516KFE0_9BACI|nr:nucleotidyltransferase [Radiobacillus deserti]QDP40077.1 nucleotidyltransferase [Radiobacillus deserti]
MEACGLIVEYNPFHNGHLYHLTKSKEQSNASCLIAVMSGNFLQRGEPAIIDKFQRTEIALRSGVDLVVELPYAYAVQHSDLFSYGAITTLANLFCPTVCFGSEHGEIEDFFSAYNVLVKEKQTFQAELHHYLGQGLSFPEASKHAYASIGLTEGSVDLSSPNNILGFSYVKAIKEYGYSIQPMTIERTSNQFHQETITSSIASATSIRKELLASKEIPNKVKQAIPVPTFEALEDYYEKTGVWHDWEHYFSLLKYRIQTMPLTELESIHGVEEGLEYRLKRTVESAVSFNDWMQTLKTKRYTWTRLQRICTHILTNTKKVDIEKMKETNTLPYVRVLGMTKTGQDYLHQIKKETDIPIYTKLPTDNSLLSVVEQRATDAYYSILSPQNQIKLKRQEVLPPIRV